MTTARHCDGPDCDTWQKTTSHLAQEWLDVTEAETGTVLHFCNWDCAVKYGARFNPPEIVGAA